MHGNQNYLTPADSIQNNIFPIAMKPTEQIVNGYDTLRFKPQPHSSVLAGGFNHQEVFPPQNCMSNTSETVSTPNINQQSKFKKGQMSARPVNIDELISNHLFQQQHQLHQSHQYHQAVIKRGNDFAQQSGKRGSNIHNASQTTTAIPNKKPSVLHQSTIQAQAQAQAMLKAAQNSNSPDKSGKEAVISNLYQLMKLGGGNLNTVMMAKNPTTTNNQQSQNQINQKNNTINDYQGRQLQHRQSFKAGITISSSGGGTKDAVNIGSSSIRSFKTIENSSSSKVLAQQSSGVIHQHILPLTNSNSRANLGIEEKHGAAQHHHQRQVSMPMQQTSAGAGFAFMSNGEGSTNDYSQYPPGTIFFDKLKRKSTAIINFMNFMTSSSTTTNAAGGNLVMPQLRNNNGVSGATTPNKHTNAPGRSTPAILTK